MRERIRPELRVMRLGPRPGEVIERDQALGFSWNGRAMLGLQGDTIASALAASGISVLSRSFKYHRPRGILTASFHDPNCLLQVDDEPNVRAGHRRLRRGMDVRAQNVWPSLELDVGSANRAVARFIGAGFYYKTFIKPQRLWPTYEKVLQHFAPGGRVLAEDGLAEDGLAEDGLAEEGHAKDGHARYDHRYAHLDVLVAGGGPAGMAAAIAAAQSGASVMLVEEEHDLGGHLRWGDAADLEALAGLRSELAGLRSELAAQRGIEVLTDSVVTGRYDDNWVAVLQRNLPGVVERLVKVRARSLVVAPGLIERPYVFEGNDLPGVMLATAVRRLVNLYAVKPGERAVVLYANPAGAAAVRDLEDAGVEIARTLDARRGENVVRARGGARVGEVELASGERVGCDLLVTAVGWTAPTSLLNMSGDRPRYERAAARFVPGGGLPDNVLATGGIVGDASTEALVAHGRATGTLAAARAGHGTARPLPALSPEPHPALFRSTTHGFVDLSEDVSSKDIVAAAREGYDSVELVKRYTTATMGAAQGKLETVNTVAVLGQATGRGIEETGTTVWRPPYVPISLGALAGRSMQPVRCSPMQSWHAAHGARPIVAGEWIRPEHYGDAAAEVRNVRHHVGIIDVTPLGKLDLRGPDVPQLLNFLYVNRWSKLDVGAVRYGVMCGEDGVVLDDGVTGRIGPEQWFTSTTSSGAAAVHEWIELWLQTARRDWQVHVTSVTSGYASINVAGPQSRLLLSRLALDVDLSPEAFPYMHVRSGTIAGVSGCHMWRIGFTGELSFELHVPAAYGLHVWEQLLEQGSDLQAAPFGLEAQRIMRLEKGHLIVGQDSDATTKAGSAGLGWLVKLDKDDFVGKPELVFEQEQGIRARLVGLQTLDTHEVPPEASQIVAGAKTIVGRITSSRFSPTLGRSICLGVVAVELAEAGSVVTVQLPDGRRINARVMEHHAHFDPEGTRLRG